MKKQELIHSHIIMAIFCGWESRKPNKEFPNGYLYLKEESDEEEEEFFVSFDTILEELPYAEDWNYLMAVWGKFRDECLNNEDEDSRKTTAFFTEIEESIISVCFYNGDKDLLFRELIRGIEKFNEITNQTEKV